MLRARTRTYLFVAFNLVLSTLIRKNVFCVCLNLVTKSTKLEMKLLINNYNKNIVSLSKMYMLFYISEQAYRQWQFISTWSGNGLIRNTKSTRRIERTSYTIRLSAGWCKCHTFKSTTRTIKEINSSFKWSLENEVSMARSCASILETCFQNTYASKKNFTWFLPYSVSSKYIGSRSRKNTQRLTGQLSNMNHYT